MSYYANMAAGIARRHRREQRLVHLQFVGDMPGTPACELEPGDRLMWNGGATAEVITVRDTSRCFIEITERYAGEHRNFDYVRRLRRDRLVVRAKPGERFPRPVTA